MAARLAAQLGRDVRPAYLSAADPLLADVVAANRAAGRRTVALSYPVSYTHLDVYKRQGLDLSQGVLVRAGHPGPVSYTHLDVYKRQVGLCSNAASDAPLNRGQPVVARRARKPAARRSTSSSSAYGASPTRTAPAAPSPRCREHSMA